MRRRASDPNGTNGIVTARVAAQPNGWFAYALRSIKRRGLEKEHAAAMRRVAIVGAQTARMKRTKVTLPEVACLKKPPLVGDEQ